MINLQRFLRSTRYLHWIGICALLGFVSYFFLRMMLASYKTPNPQALLVLGGDPKREKVAANLASQHPTLPIWVSSGSLPNESRMIFRQAGISQDRLHIDTRAYDTVTNFTSLVEDFKGQNFQHIYLITSDCHMPRAKVIAIVVLGGQGITFTPVSVPSNHSQESFFEIVGDAGRSLLWFFTNRSGTGLKTLFRP
jgi:uncharacterized SAM-binding protein YcdF (DUF218 family)